MNNSEKRALIARIAKDIQCEAAQATINVELFRLAAIKGDMTEVERLRDVVLTIQGKMMDNICARIMLMKQTGLLQA